MLPGAELAENAAEMGLSIVATGVVRDDDAVGLIDLGIDLMEGERFSGPRRIRSSAARQAALAGM
jgi:EAL domain-containing protein (putative c-di-GMP-specific phosphodiesterase class I)